MNFKTLLTASLAVAVSLTACKKDNPVTPAPEEKNLEIKVSASLYQFTKATDTAFEEGDVIGVNIFNPDCYLYNAHFTYKNGQLKSETAYEWYENTELEATVTAMYPCYDTLESYLGTQSFIINADQSTKTGYAMSDLMLAATKSKPTSEAVNLPFKHALSKIVVTVDNKLGEDIANVWFTDVLGEVSFDPKNPFAMTTTGSKGTVKAYKSSADTWQLIIAPQTEASPKLALTTASGKQYTFTLSENVTFTSGKVSTATVEVSTESIYTSFTPEITDWVADNELNFSQDENSEVELPEDPAVYTLTVKVNKTIEWYDKYLYTWDSNGTLLSGDWPGTKMAWDKEDGDYYIYYHEFGTSIAATTFNYIINNGTGGVDNQTNDLTVTLDGYNTTVVIESTDVIVELQQ